MKKIISILVILTIVFLFAFTLSSNAAPLDSLTINTSKATVHPGDTVNINLSFGQPLGAYTFEIDFDDNLFEYVTATNVTTGSVSGDKVTAYFFDSTGGSNPNSDMTITFRAKTGITTSNPTNFAITATGLANNDGSVQLDDIVVPITKNIIVEPVYSNYDFAFNYTSPIIPNEVKEMKLTIASTMGRYYDHVRLLVEATKPDGSTIQLLGTDGGGNEHNLIDSGWGDPSGFGLGGDVNEELNLRGVFSHLGDYTLTFKLIDRDSSDAVIASRTFNIKTGEISEELTQKEELPRELPKTGSNYIYIIISIVSLIIILTSIGIVKKD